MYAMSIDFPLQHHASEASQTILSFLQKMKTSFIKQLQDGQRERLHEVIAANSKCPATATKACHEGSCHARLRYTCLTDVTRARIHLAGPSCCSPLFSWCLSGIAPETWRASRNIHSRRCHMSHMGSARRESGSWRNAPCHPLPNWIGAWGYVNCRSWTIGFCGLLLWLNLLSLLTRSCSDIL